MEGVGSVVVLLLLLFLFCSCNFLSADGAVRKIAANLPNWQQLEFSFSFRALGPRNHRVVRGIRVSVFSKFHILKKNINNDLKPLYVIRT